MAGVIEKDVVVIGAGISGLATAKCLKDDRFDVAVLERTDQVGGLWTFREKDYGVMRCTHINVCKYNYCFSDFPFPETVPDYPHHSDMANYIRDYTTHFDLYSHIMFRVKVTRVEQTGEKWRVTYVKTEADGKTEVPDSKQVIVCSHVAITTGHHAKPSWPKLRGQETFKGDIIHSVDFKDSISSTCAGKRILVVGMGNSAVDCAVDCVTVGRCKKVYMSTRSGAWAIPNYIFGFPTDLYACRFFFLLPHWLRNMILETIITLVAGSPWKWGLNPKMRALEAQPTVDATLVHHIQRQNIKIVPNIAHIDGSTVYFVNGKFEDFDQIVYCTGYSVDLPYLSESLSNSVLGDSNQIKLYKSVFAPEIGPTLAFIGFVQPASGGVLTMAETQARWFSELCKGSIKLPTGNEMKLSIKSEKEENAKRYYKSARHTLQRDPVVYCDEIASFFGAKPDFLSNPSLAWRLLFGAGGASQWRLKGPHSWHGAALQVKSIPITHLMSITGYFIAGCLLFLAYYLFTTIRNIF